jgi:hypothetical protein
MKRKKPRNRKVKKDVNVRIYDTLMIIYNGNSQKVNQRYKMIQFKCEFNLYQEA